MAMNESPRDSNSSSSDFGGMFQEEDSKNCVFYFDRMRIHRNQADNCTQVVFCFSYAHKYSFESRLQIPCYVPVELNDAIHSIGMCHLLWYWMGFGTDTIDISTHMSEATRQFWESFYNTVTLEFKYVHPSVGMIALRSVADMQDSPFIQESVAPLFEYTDAPNYRRGISIPSPTAIFPSSGSSSSSTISSSEIGDDTTGSVLCPLGGGKDSLVVWRRCTEANRRPVLLYCCDTLYEFESNWRVQQLARMMQSPLFIIRHDFRSEEFEKHARSYLYPCGHPWAALVLFDSVLACTLLGVEEAWLGCERSADEGNGVCWRGEEVNHQYDKSSQFMQLANQFVHNELCLPVRISSPLTRIWELEIARTFCLDASLKPFHSVFLSCNEASKGTNWCRKCEKCCFIYLLLSAWLPPRAVDSIFQDRISIDQTSDDTCISLFGTESLLPVFMKLIGGDENKLKAFECVGTFSEASAAVELSLHQYVRDNIEIPPVLRSLCQYLHIDPSERKPDCFDDLVANIYKKWNIDV